MKIIHQTNTVLFILSVFLLAGCDSKAQETQYAKPQGPPTFAEVLRESPENQKAEPIDRASVEPFDLDKLVSGCKKSEKTLAENLAVISSYEREIAQIRDDLRQKENLKKSDPPKQPVKRSDWSTLKMGEFEEEAVFKKRVELAKHKSETDYSKAIDEWKGNVKSHNDQWDSYVKTLPDIRKSTMEKIEAIEKKIAIERKKSDSIQTKVMIFFPYKCEQLPTFERTTMSFPSVTLFPCGNEWGISRAKEHCRFSFTGDANKTQSLYFPTLEKAKAFKESHERNEVSFWVVVEVQYIESTYEKVITQTALYQTVTTNTKLQNTLFHVAVAALIQYNGGSVPQWDGPVDNYVTRQELVSPEKSYNGTFHRYGAKMVGPVLAADKNGLLIDIKSGK